jgi:hypothetical protein
MRFLTPFVGLRGFAGLAGLAVLAGSVLAGCSGGAGDSSSTSEAAYTDDASATPEAACSLQYWAWVLNDLQPQLARPIAEVSDAQMTAFLATRPPPADTVHSYGVCWTPMFDTHFFAPAAMALHGAGVTFLDRMSPDYLSYAAYKAHVAMTPELRRNAKALLALRPATMTPNDASIWMSTYGNVLAEVIRPVAVPGTLQYEGIQEPEWVITDAESEYLTVVEQARAAPSRDGAYAEWMSDFGRWVLGPPPAVSRSFVFNLLWEPGANGDTYGLSGVVAAGGVPVMPPLVQAFVKRLANAAPPALGESDSASWMSVYNGRALRALGDLPQNEPLLTKTDILALDVLESARPATLRGAFPYETWLDLYVIAAGQRDDAWATRIAALEPCLDAPDLAAAQEKLTTKTAALASPAIAAPHVCAD